MNDMLAISFMEAISHLNEIEKEIVGKLWGINGFAKEDIRVLSEEMGIDRQKIKQIEAKVKRKLRHPNLSKIYKDHYRKEHDIIRVAVMVLDT